MPAAPDNTHGQRICAVEVSPGEVDAGTALTVTVQVSRAYGCDLRGQRISIRDGNDTELANAEPFASDDEACATNAFVLSAPLETGEHVHRAVLATQDQDGIWHEETSTAFSFVTKPHAANVNVWGLPSAIAAGERFGFKVGIKCSAGCKLTGRQVSIFDHHGAPAGTASLRDDAWPETSALYFAEVEAQAPHTVGDYVWRIEVPASVSGVPHAAGSCTFAIKIVSPPDHEVTVEAFDSESLSPIKGAHVLLHPYRAFTDETGVAKVKVAKGRYKLFVSGFNYIEYRYIIDVDGDVRLRAELTTEPEGLEDYR